MQAEREGAERGSGQPEAETFVESTHPEISTAHLADSVGAPEATHAVAFLISARVILII